MPKFPRKLERKKLPKNSRNVEVRRTYQEEASGAKAECEREGETGRGCKLEAAYFMRELLGLIQLKQVTDSLQFKLRQDSNTPSQSPSPFMKPRVTHCNIQYQHLESTFNTSHSHSHRARIEAGSCCTGQPASLCHIPLQ